MRLVGVLFLLGVVFFIGYAVGLGGHHVAVATPADVTVSAEQASPLAFFTSLLVWEFIAFFIFLIVLGKFAIPKMLGGLQARQERIEHAMDKADTLKAEAEELQKKHSKMIEDAHAEAKRITDEAIREAEKIHSKIVGEAHDEAEEAVKHAKNEIRMAQTRAMAELRERAVELSLLAGSAVLKRSLNDDDHRRMAKEAIATAGVELSGKN